MPKITKEKALARLEKTGQLVPNCSGCMVWYESADPVFVLAPPHKNSSFCESGRRPHCTCDSCF